MVGRYTVVGAALLLLAVFNTLSSVNAEPTLKDLMLQDQAAKQLARGGPTAAPTQKPAAPAAAKPTKRAKPAKAAKPTKLTKAAKPTKLTKAAKPAKAAKAAEPAKKSDSTGKTASNKGPEVKKPQASRSPSAAPAFAHVARQFEAPMKQGSSGGAAGQAALGTSAMIGIGVGVGVACLVAVGAVVGILVHLRRRKSKGTQLEKQKTYGGTE